MTAKEKVRTLYPEAIMRQRKHRYRIRVKRDGHWVNLTKSEAGETVAWEAAARKLLAEALLK